MIRQPRTAVQRAEEQDWRHAANGPLWARLEADREATRAPGWVWWLAAPVVVAFTVLLSMHWPMGWAP